MPQLSEAKSKSRKHAKPKAAPKEKKVADFIQRLPVPLTDVELLDFGQRLAKCQADLGEHLAHAETLKKELKAKESAIEAERARLSGIIREKKESRDVPCERWAYYGDGEIVEIRNDTGEVIYRRRMEMHERQATLPIDGAPVPPLTKPVDAQEIASATAPGRSPPPFTEQNPDEPDADPF